MPKRIYLVIACVGSLAMLLVGCGTVSVAGRGSVAKAPLGEWTRQDGPSEDFSRAAMDRRAEAQARYANAVLHDWNEETEPAAAEYFKAAMADPANQELVLEVAHRLLQLKQNDKAVEVLTKATAMSNASGVVFAQLGRLYALLGKTDQAIAADRTAIKRAPRSLFGYRYLAQIYSDNRQFTEGLEVLDHASKQSGVDATFLVELSELYAAFMRGGTNAIVKSHALDALHRAARLNPTSAFLLQKLADGFAVLGDAEQATLYYLKLIERFPALPGVREKLTDIYIQKQDRKKAAEQLQAIIRDNPTNPQAYYFLGALALEDKRYKDARDYFNKAILFNPNLEPVYYDLASAQINLDQPREALTTLERARQMFSQNFVSEFYTAMAYTRMKEYSNSIVHLTAAEVIARAADTNRLTPNFYFQLGSAYERNRKYDEAELNFKKCLERAPDFSEALNYLGYMWAERGVNLPQAKELIEKAVKQEPKNAAFLDSLGWVLYKLDQPQEALKHILKSIELAEEPDATLYDHLGDIYLSLRQPAKAREAWRKSLSIEPSEPIQKKLGAESVSETKPR